MTFTIKTKTIRDLQVYMEQEKFSSAYKVGILRLEETYGRILDERIYPTREKAQRRFRQLEKDVEVYRW